MLQLIISQLTLTFIKHPSVKHISERIPQEERQKVKVSFKITEPKNATERKKVEQGLHNMGIGQAIKTFKFSRNSVLCDDHFHKDCIKRNLMYEHFNMQSGKNELVEGAVPTNFARQIFDQINMDGTKVLLTRHVSENKRKRDVEKDYQQVSFVSE